MNKIAFFGASVTQQKNGFCTYFSSMNPDVRLRVFGYGAMHLNDAGVIYIDHVLQYKPDYCFIDWFSTGYIEYNKHDFNDIKQYIDTIIHRFTKHSIKIIFLTFPHRGTNRFTNEPIDKSAIYKKMNDYIRSYDIPVIDLSESFDNLDLILRDNVHTSDLGSQEYARLISDDFNTNIRGKIGLPSKLPDENMFCDIRSADINTVVKDSITFEGFADVVGISQKIGPYTGLLSINNKIHNNWDKWCYYERDMINLKFNISDVCKIEVLQDSFDTSECKHQINWCDQKLLKLYKCYYVGDISNISCK